jgi:hypothetical protein
VRWLSILALVVGCGFRHGVSYALDGGSDAQTTPIDAPAPPIDAPPPFCSSDAHLRLCFSFDQNPVPGTLPNEGAAAVTAQVSSVGSIPSPMGRAVQMSAASDIFLAMGTGVTGIQTAEVWFRFDQEIATNGDRIGLYDSNTVQNISLFFYRVDPIHQLRCGMFNETQVWDAPQLQPGPWFHLVCVCDGTSLHMFVDGTDLGGIAGDCAGGGAFVQDGFTIGSDNYGGGGGASAQLVGAVDGIRLWDTVRLP